MKFLRLSAMLMVFVLVLTAVVACGDDDDDDDTTGGDTATTVATTAGEATEAGEEATEADEGDDGAAAAGDAANGETLATSKGCVACHSVDGSEMTGPTWQGLYGHEVTLEDGTTVTADDEYIKNSILKPNDQIVEGFTPAMPSFEGQVTDQEIADLTAYIASLE